MFLTHLKCTFKISTPSLKCLFLYRLLLFINYFLTSVPHMFSLLDHIKRKIRSFVLTQHMSGTPPSNAECMADIMM